MSASAVTVHKFQSRESGQLHPEPLPAHRVEHDCIEVHGYPQCMGAAAMDAGHCTCIHLTPEQHAQCEDEAWQVHRERDGDPCADCAFRKGSPEEDQLEQIAAQDEPFHCHQRMPVRAVGGVPQRDDYAPRDRTLYPICSGWQRAHDALSRRAE